MSTAEWDQTVTLESGEELEIFVCPECDYRFGIDKDAVEECGMEIGDDGNRLVFCPICSTQVELDMP